MTNTQKFVLNIGGRIIIASFGAEFLSEAALALMKDKKLISKLIIFGGMGACALGIGHSIDLFMNQFLPKGDETEKWTEKELWKTEE